MIERVRGDIKYRLKNFRLQEKDLRSRLSVIFLLTGFILSLVGFLTTVFMSQPYWYVIPNILVMLMCLIIPLLADDLDKITLYALYVVGILYFPYIYYTSGGNYGPTPIYFVMIVAYMAFYMEGKRLIITNSLFVIYYVTIMIFGFQNPNIPVAYIDEISRLIDYIVAVISVSLVISVISNSTFRGYTKEHEKTFSLMKELETQNDKLKELSIKDQLTGVYNRRYFMEVIDSEIKHYDTYKKLFHVMMIDLDDFKKVNDEHGHLFGDEVLRKVAQQINKTTRDYDVISRYGGEEFCVIVSHLNPEDSIVIAERIRLHVENLDLRNNVKITVSIGVTSFCEGDTNKKLISRADEALYQAKSQGKNCVVNKEGN
ncbi:Response regulator PleD [Candidatus Izimaplasma bacterium HR1]|jgi:diguanylate cyclase (GGDEF)-like protein|uniref:GGDEF domain-containing protein n=1 Tax=Candidatus Izimoplasma sp. HR1 TaxID=1541959 RepID=UPI0004F5C202|nr:Response regulator PleD [Candidatus Izimaplasma bacterium HR1]